jgi:KDO2-lipid IV(A) lauroyltransferase
VGRILPFGACRAIAGPIAWGAWRLGLRRRITEINLRLAFPDLDDRELERIARASYRSLITVSLEILTLRYLGRRGIERILSVENIELLETIPSEGAILLSGHYGNWELLALGAAALSNVPFTVIVTEQKDGGELERTRTALGNRLIPTGRGARESAALLKKGGVLALLADQAAAVDDPRVNLMGIPTPFHVSAARLALRFRTRIIAGYAERQSDGRYRVMLEEIPHDDLPDTPEGARLLTERYARTLEAAIARHPEQWVWQHRRWKHQEGIRY